MNKINYFYVIVPKIYSNSNKTTTKRKKVVFYLNLNDKFNKQKRHGN
jgi:hypothetical protein